ncbi:MAG: HNH endonuclease [Polaromonas sp.]|uniref:HNH endonuclease n=1 Tax=Polaromonas sp. TaxID=1869339 RepID=UPI00273654B9|nr:HNH endonuclease [Polaromonas sp.]MDP2819279.1 HNH endonuclease [Polaromonas sp.]
MVAQPVEWVLVIYYGPSAHRATYGRLDGTKYTKDYLQLSKKAEFLDAVRHLFPVSISDAGSVPLTYQWPTGTTPGALVFNSADRPHLKWETSLGAPKAWRMSLTPSEATAETIPGNPSHLNFADAENELALLAACGAGQPYLIAIKLRDEARTLHLRAYLKDPSEDYEWADLKLVPQEIQALAEKTSRQSALAWALLHSAGTAPTAEIDYAISQLVNSENRKAVIDALGIDAGRALASYLRAPGHGLFFDPALNHDAWVKPEPLATAIAASIDDFLHALQARFPEVSQSDASAEALESDPEEVEVFRQKIEQKNYEIADSTATVKTRGSAQKVFAVAVKNNYAYRCAITGIGTKDFLVASHIVPWSEDQTIRLDPSNGICLSLLVDRAFEKGQLLIEDDFTIRINLDKVGDDHALRSQLEPYDGRKLSMPEKEAPQVKYLQRRRSLVECK